MNQANLQLKIDLPTYNSINSSYGRSHISHQSFRRIESSYISTNDDANLKS
jgi:hypothetical protein